jgi:glycosyltransferase involved in cell wall biosynthesis
MADSALAILPWLTVCLATLPLTLIAGNLLLLHRLPRAESARKVSVLIPARDEASNIGAAIESVLANRAANFELLVLDDDSTDATARIVADWSRLDQRVRLIHGPAHDPGLWGKPQACAALADAACGDYFLFMDADVRLAADALQRLGAALDHSECALLSGVPLQQTVGFAEKLIIPLIQFHLLGFLPLAGMRRSRRPGFGVACGQLLAVKRDAYFESGGHRRIADRIHDGMALARAFRAAGHMTDLADFTDLASCRMYRSAPDLISGFAKNAHEGLGSPAGIVPWTLLLLGGQCAWILLLPAAFAGAVSWVPLLLTAAAVYAARLLVDLRFRQSPLGTLLHPVGVFALVLIQWYALASRLAGKPVAWKARVPESPPVTVVQARPAPR